MAVEARDGAGAVLAVLGPADMHTWLTARGYTWLAGSRGVWVRA
jgi:hypothetical protein